MQSISIYQSIYQSVIGQGRMHSGCMCIFCILFSRFPFQLQTVTATKERRGFGHRHLFYVICFVWGKKRRAHTLWCCWFLCVAVDFRKKKIRLASKNEKKRRSRIGLVFSPRGSRKKEHAAVFYFFPICLLAPSNRLRSRLGKDNGQTKKEKEEVKKRKKRRGRLVVCRVVAEPDAGQAQCLGAAQQRAVAFDGPSPLA